MWIVTTDYVRGELTYFVEDKDTGERKGAFGCEPWAREFANELNRQMARNKKKVVILKGIRMTNSVFKAFLNKYKDRITSSDSLKFPYVACLESGDIYYFMTAHYFEAWKKKNDKYDIVAERTV